MFQLVAVEQDHTHLSALLLRVQQTVGQLGHRALAGVQHGAARLAAGKQRLDRAEHVMVVESVRLRLRFVDHGRCGRFGGGALVGVRGARVVRSGGAVRGVRGWLSGGRAEEALETEELTPHWINQVDVSLRRDTCLRHSRPRVAGAPARECSSSAGGRWLVADLEMHGVRELELSQRSSLARAVGRSNRKAWLVVMAKIELIISG